MLRLCFNELLGFLVTQCLLCHDLHCYLSDSAVRQTLLKVHELQVASFKMQEVCRGGNRRHEPSSSARVGNRRWY